MNKARLFAVAALTFATVGVTANFAGVASLRNLMAAKGSIKGHVLNSQGAPAASVPVKIFAPINNAGGAGGNRSGGFDGTLGENSPTFLQGKNTVLMQVVTNEKGDFEVKAIDAGTYRFIAGTRPSGMNGGSVTVEAGKEATVEVKLNPPPGR